MYNNDRRTSLAHKILIPVVLLIAAGAAAPLFLLKYEKISNSLSYSGSDPVRMSLLVLNGVSENQDEFHYDLYSTVGKLKNASVLALEFDRLNNKLILP